ncbi:MAG: ankyrin repeat domain-containing protein [Pseudomonadota bacterium]|nr:ankyrin repeat domain-containing protein [Pseudomonadota bacterium]
MSRKMSLGVAAALVMALAAQPGQSQRFSDSYTFIQGVKERDGGKVEALVSVPGSTVINAKDGNGDGALHIVTRGRDRVWLSFLLGKGAKPDLPNRDGSSALILASQLGWMEGAELLLRFKANVDLANNRGETPLIFAVHNRDVAMTRLLLGRGANPKRTDSVAGYSALDYARQDKRAAAVLKLLEAPPAPSKPVAGPKL